MKLNKKQCATCPFRDGSPYTHLRQYLETSAISKASRICHSTGGNNAINHRTGKPARLCRGARDFQLRVFFEMGFLDEATDAAWDKRKKEMGIK